MASEMRTKLGESLNTVQKFNTPLVEATTQSLEALQAFSLGLEALVELGDDARSIPFLQKAVELDPNFALAYSWLASAYDDLGESMQAAQNAQKSFDLRGRVSERERLAIETYYHISVTGDFQKAQQSAEFWAQIYPRDWDAHLLLGIASDALGQNDKALVAHEEALHLNPTSRTMYGNLVFSNLLANRLDQAKMLVEEAEAKKLDSYELREALYLLAFLGNDEAGMAQAVAWSAAKPAVEGEFLFYEAATKAYYGRLRKAREFTDRAVALAEQARQPETASTYEADAAIREALFGNSDEARRRAKSALSHSNGELTQYGAAQALAFAGDAAQAMALADDSDKRFSENTLVQFKYLPSVRGQLALTRNDAPKAVELLEVAAPYELGWYGVTAFAPSLYPVYVRGLAYLAANKPPEATAEFQKVLDHRGIVINEPIGALSHLGRAYAMQGDFAKARSAYQDFLTLWKDADPDIPILKEAKAEYSNLQ
jgi:eukaryotic-like serine/threonine-protein kinase